MNNGIRMPEYSRISKNGFPLDGNEWRGFSPKVG
jgi:hypothetical protein